VAREQDEAARAAWREQARQLAALDLVGVPETGAHIALTPLYARAPRGQRAVGKVPRNYGANTTMIASLSRQDMGEALILEGAADTEALFEAIAQAFLTATDALGWFKHCGYPLPIQCEPLSCSETEELIAQ
jgi:hypothetical protein